ncbi:acetate--CoA ligase [Caldinitratiruptor microaerophilus]|uniref:Acetyl-coenzyme A synthetase n=1 Tax=Caldinitratiruptor microaerophilus TaxID=671077 RepID=A0AA35G6Z6_9FIRM|nr:acetate--CoA ligase [Caldinitratiruptor microaerophilus]BDG62086.1 acetyl-coenzyme A synthetase [Caldinitratiruptor microaerophilus]
MSSQEKIAALLQENRLFPPPPDFAERAHVKDMSLHEWARKDRLGFWAAMAERLHWFKKWDTVLEWEPPFYKWFVGGKLNASYNCIDRHLTSWRRNKAAIIWEGEPGDERVLTYQDLHREVSKAANMLKSLGVRRGDRVTIYLPMIPELPIAMLACARIGAIHSVVFGGFSAESLAGRINDAQAKIVITADGGWRRGNVVPLKQNTDEALKSCPSVEKVIVVKRIGHESLVHHNWVEGRDLWWHTLMRNQPDTCPVEEMDAEDPLYILYTSGSTGKPKGVLHTTGGYLTGVAATTHYVFDLKDEDVYWCTADIGWVTGHSYIVYGPLAEGATTVMYEGTPDYPDRGRFWDIVQKYRVNILYTAPTAIRSFMKWGEEWPARYDLSSLRLIGTVGEPINPEAWIWYHQHIGRGKCPIVDTWWQTETGMIMITPLPGVTHTKPGSATIPFPGVSAEVVDGAGNPVGPGEGGFLVLTEPAPAMLRTVWGDPDRYVAQYYSRFGKSVYFTGDGAKKDENGYFIIVGRVDDVINVSGHRIGTWEVESALVDHPAVAEAAVIGRNHDIKGQAISAFVILKEGHQPSEAMEKELKEHVVRKIGALARPEEILFTADLPKTRSGKIMRRLLRDIAEGRALGDTTTLADPAVVQQLKEKYEATEGGGV